MALSKSLPAPGSAGVHTVGAFLFVETAHREMTAGPCNMDACSHREGRRCRTQACDVIPQEWNDVRQSRFQRSDPGEAVLLSLAFFGYYYVFSVNNPGYDNFKR